VITIYSTSVLTLAVGWQEKTCCKGSALGTRPHLE